MPNEQYADQVEQVSSLNFEATVGRLIAAIEGAGMTVFARIDHAANAADAGMTLAPATVLIYGNAKGGTPIMQAVPRAALDLPLRVLVREEDAGRTVVSFHPVGPMLQRAGVPEALAAGLEPAQRLLITAIQS